MVDSLQGLGKRQRDTQLTLFVFFDGECLLCNGFVDFVLARMAPPALRSTKPSTNLSSGLLAANPASLPFLYLASLQGKTAQQMLLPELRKAPFESLVVLRRVSTTKPLKDQEPVAEQGSHKANVPFSQGVADKPLLSSRAVLAILHCVALRSPRLSLWGLTLRFVIHFSKCIPFQVQEWIYWWVSKNRIRFFGKSSTCRLPTPEERKLGILLD